ncbi:PTS glucose transporter subunit IIA [Catenibacillus scindens]|uniref:PTS glucose transporter subunit IIA n=1 Tax=Catenibacillus scindens TaxID=673271 RepID=UPI002ED33D9B
MQQGDRVVRGQQLLDVDLALLKEKGYVTQTPVLVVNPEEMKEIKITDQKQVAENDDLVTVSYKS